MEKKARKKIRYIAVKSIRPYLIPGFTIFTVWLLVFFSLYLLKDEPVIEKYTHSVAEYQ